MFFIKKLFLFVFLVFSSFSVFAQDFTVSNSDISSPNSSGTGKYTGTEIYNTGTSNVYNIGTRYNGRLSRIVFNLASGGYADANGFEKGHTYTLTLNMATEDWRNNFGSVSVKCEGSSGTELSNGRVNYISYKKIKFSFTAPSNSWCQFVYIDLKSTNITNTAFTGTSNWNLSSIVITDPYYSSSGGSGGTGTTPTPTPSNDYSSIINNQTQNTQDIINSQNQNTNDIIENNNQNTQDIIDNQNKNTESTNNLLGDCYKNYSSSDSLIITYQGGASGFSSLESIPVEFGRYYVSFKPVPYGLSRVVVSLYDQNNNIIGNQSFVSDQTFSAYNSFYQGFYLDIAGVSNPKFYLAFYDNVKYFVVKFVSLYEPNQLYDKIMISPSSQSYIPSGTQKCSSKIDSTNQSLEDINNSINNDNVDDKTSFFTNFQNDTHGLTGIITLPLTTIQSLTNSSCVSLAIPIPFTNSNVSLPCMTEVYQTYIPSVYSIWQIVSFGIISYFICLDIFKIVKGFKDPNEDKIEVLDL